MAPSLMYYIFLQLFLLANANNDFTINPQNPMVPLGGSIRLNCSTNSPLCTTNWKGLDISIGSVYSVPGYSILTIENASIPMEGTKICVKICPGRSKTLIESVFLKVYALPETLLLSTSITNGILYLHCLLKGIRPWPNVNVQCYRGFDKLDTSAYTEDITHNDDWDIFNITRRWEISNHDFTQPQTFYSCEGNISWDEYGTFRIEGILEIPNEVGTTDTLPTTVTVTQSQTKAMTTTYPKTITTSTDSATLYTRTSKKWTPSPPSTSSVFSSPTTFKDFSTPDTLSTTDILATAMTNTEIQDTTMRTPKTISSSRKTTTVYIETPKDRTTSPPIISTVFDDLSKHNELSSSDTVWTTEPVAVTVTNTKNQTTVMTTATPTTQRTTPSQSIKLISLTTHTVLPPSNTDTFLWMIIPAAGLAGSILIILQIWRQLHRKGFFQPNQLRWSDYKHGTKDFVCSLESGPSYLSVK